VIITDLEIAVGVRHQLCSRPYPSYELWDRPLHTYKVFFYDGASLTRRVITDSSRRKSVGISCVSLYVCVALFDTKRDIYMGVGKAVNSSATSNKVAKCTARKKLHY
jgi:hypothetical protein